jgi:MtfA peptidase
MLFVLIAIAAFTFLYLSSNKDVKAGLHYANRRTVPIRTRVLPIPQRFRDILSKYFPYYQKLSPSNQKLFEKKVVKFYHSKRFVPRNVPEVTIEAKILISASAVQLTFGLPDVYLDHFHTILVYPNDYYSSITKRFHKGEVNPRFGIVVLSWQSFVDGYIYPTDSFNVGLHEMAHALRLENIIRDEEYHFFDEELMACFDEYAVSYCKGDVQDPTHFLRPYACTNIHEFFSVSVENFFERSRSFRETLPQLYAILVKLLNQDPVELTET